jgi:hypothetical protein
MDGISSTEDEIQCQEEGEENEACEHSSIIHLVFCFQGEGGGGGGGCITAEVPRPVIRNKQVLYLYC